MSHLLSQKQLLERANCLRDYALSPKFFACGVDNVIATTFQDWQADHDYWLNAISCSITGGDSTGEYQLLAAWRTISGIPTVFAGGGSQEQPQMIAHFADGGKFSSNFSKVNRIIRFEDAGLYIQKGDILTFSLQATTSGSAAFIAISGLYLLPTLMR